MSGWLASVTVFHHVLFAVLTTALQYLNSNIVSLEQYVINNPFHVLSFVAVFFVLAFYGLKRFVFSDTEDIRGGKNGRLD